jgi:hypothetical protein
MTAIKELNDCHQEQTVAKELVKIQEGPIVLAAF